MLANRAAMWEQAMAPALASVLVAVAMAASVTAGQTTKRHTDTFAIE